MDSCHSLNRRAFLSSSGSLLGATCLPQFLLQNAQAQTPAKEGDTAPRRVAILGHTGRGNYGHGLDTLWLKMPGTSIVGVSDPDSAGLANAQKRLGAPKAFARYEELLESLHPDVVSICPRHVDQHHAMLVHAIQTGVRAIYIEKPFVRTPAEADEVLQLSREKNVKIAIAHRNRYHPALPLLMQRLAAGDFGVPLEVRARGKEDQRSGGLDLWVLGSHILNVAVALAGRPLACQATLFNKGKPSGPEDVRPGDEGVGLIAGDELHARFEMESGLPFFFESRRNTSGKNSNFGLQIVCSEALIDLRFDTEPFIHVLAGNPFAPSPEPRQWKAFTSGGLGVPEPHPSIRDWVSGHVGPASDLLACIGTERQPLCAAESGLLVVEMIQSVFASHLQTGKRVQLPMSWRGNAFEKSQN
jgi:predicted dehydrogenase